MIYFAVWPESEWLGGTVKIGYTRDLPKREKELGAEFVDAILGDAFDESYLHKTLRPFRAHQQIGRCEYYAMFPAIEVLLHLPTWLKQAVVDHRLLTRFIEWVQAPEVA